MKPGDVCLALFPLGGAGGRKLRPVLVLTPPVGSVPEYVVAYVSSATPPDPLPSDLWLDPADPETASSGVTKRSVVRLHKIATLHQRDLVRLLGTLDDPMLQRVRDVVRRTLAL